MKLDKLKDHICTEEIKYDIRHKEVYIGDIVCLPGSYSNCLKIAVVYGFTPTGFRLVNTKGEKQNYFGSLLNITGLYNSNDIKEFDKIRDDRKNEEEKIKKSKITEKLILAVFFNKNSKEFGIYTHIISSKPGKAISKFEILNAISEMKSKYPNFDLYFMNKNFNFEDKNSNSIPHLFTDYSLPCKMFDISFIHKDLYANPMVAIRIANKYGVVDSDKVERLYSTRYNSRIGTEKYIFKTDNAGYCLINPVIYGWKDKSSSDKTPIFIQNINSLFEKFEKENSL